MMAYFFKGLEAWCQNYNGERRYFIFNARFNSKEHWEELNDCSFVTLKESIENWLGEKGYKDWLVDGVIKTSDQLGPEHPTQFVDATTILDSPHR